MKKIFTLAALFAVSVGTAMAADYTDTLTVSINGTATKQTSVVNVDESDGEYTLTLKNFKLSLAGQTMNVGTIVIDGLKGSESNGSTIFRASKKIKIQNGDETGVAWIGPMLGEVPISLTSAMTADKLHALIDISFSGMAINVDFGSGYQIPNSDFESFHKASVSMGDDSAESDEPDAWHSFMSASGVPALVYMAGYNPHTFISDDVRPGSTGKSSVKLLAIDMWIAIANGTMTTGRINTGSATASDITQNYSWNDMSETERDPIGDPFYALMNSQPDSLTVWVKFAQGTPQADAPYATINAVINDGTRYQDPEGDKEYTNVVAKATDAEIATTNGEWKQLTIPFDYDSYKSNNATGKAILVTVSTNAQAGKGSDGDEMYVDDLSLIYNHELSSLSINGTPVKGFDKGVTTYDVTVDGDVTADNVEAVADGRSAFVVKNVEASADDANKSTVTVDVISGDLKSTTTYTVNVTKETTGIDNVENTMADGAEKVYNINGQRVDGASQHGVYIIRKADGSTVKVLKK